MSNSVVWKFVYSYQMVFVRCHSLWNNPHWFLTFYPAPTDGRRLFKIYQDSMKPVRDFLTAVRSHEIAMRFHLPLSISPSAANAAVRDYGQILEKLNKAQKAAMAKQSKGKRK